MADVATLVFDIDSSQARGAAKALADLNSAAIRAANGASRFDKTMRDTNGRFVSNAKVAAASREEIEALARAYNPAMAAQIRYRDEVIKTGVAVRAGVITEQQRVDILNRVKAGIDAAAGASQRLGRANQATGFHTANVFAQLNDIGVMMAAGQNPIQLALQQGTQLNQVWTAMGKEGRSVAGVAGVLRGAFASMISPMSLLTLGVIAGAAALTQWGFSALGASKDVKTLEDTMSSMRSSVDALKSSQEQSRKTILDLVKDYGLLASVARQAIQNMTEVDKLRAAVAINEALTKSIEAVTRFSWSGVDQGLDASIAKVGQLSTEWVNLSLALGNFKSAQTDIEKIAAARTLSKEMMAAYGSLEKMPKEMQDLYFSLQNVILNLSAAQAATSDWAGRMSSVLSYINAIQSSMANISGGAIRLAAIRTETELLKQGKSLREASLAATRQTAQLEGAAKTRELEKQYGWAGKLLGIAQQNQAIATIEAENRLDLEREAAREREKAASGKGGGGAAARELAAAEKGFQSLRELLEKESLYQVAEWEKRQAQLDMAYAKKLLSEQNYQEMRKQLQQMYFGTEFEQNNLRYQMDLEQLDLFHAQGLLKEEQYQIAKRDIEFKYMRESSGINGNLMSSQLSNWGQYFGDLNSLAGGGFDKLIRVQRVFAASSALINTWLGYTEALANNPLMPPWMKLAWAGKILAAGLGAVSAIKGGGGGKGSGASTASAAAKAEPQRNVLVRLEGDEWLTSMAETIMTEIYEQTGNGRVVVQRDYS